jgi:predicted transcriptional regulator
MAGEKYRMFKQFMHNELGITKDDIRDWIKEAVREEAAKLIAKTYDDYDVKREIRDMLRSPYDSIRKDITNAAATEICKHVKLVVDKPINMDEP